MRLEEFLPDILRRWWIILLATATAGAVGFIVASNEPDEYSVSVRLVAVAEPVDYWLDLYAKNRLATYEPLINNYTFVQEALLDAGLDIDPGAAQQALRVSHASNQNTLTITVVDGNPQRAADIANAIQYAFIRLNDEQNESLIDRFERDPEIATPRVVLSSIESAGPPADPLPKNVTPTTVAAALLGAIAGGIVVVYLVYRDDVLRSAEDIDRHLSSPVLAVVPEDLSAVER